jgi:hypothetical protein
VRFLLKKFPRITPVARPNVPSSPVVRINAVTRTSMRVKPRVLLSTARRVLKEFWPMLVDLYVARRTDLDDFGATWIANCYRGI